MMPLQHSVVLCARRSRVAARRGLLRGVTSGGSSSSSSSSSGWGQTASDLEPLDYGPGFGFEVVQSRDGPSGESGPRLGVLRTPHGQLHTPAFVFCATKAAVKGTTIDALQREQTQIILSNTYHLMNRPGADVVAEMGGLHRFMRWDGPMLTDSGGYQIFSMGGNRVGDEIKGSRGRAAEAIPGEGGPREGTTLLEISEEGAAFRSYVDGSLQMLSPEESMDIQRKLGADLVVVLDECTPFHVDPMYTELSMNRSHRWALRSLRAFRQRHTGAQALYGIVQGGVHRELRDLSVDFVKALPFFGIAIGGSLGDSVPTMHDVVQYTRRRIGSTSRPVHLLGIGGVVDIFHGVRCGIDTFDCVMPTRAARHGNAMVMAHHWEPPEEGEGADGSDTAAAAATAGAAVVPEDHPHREELGKIDGAIQSIRQQLRAQEKVQVELFEQARGEVSDRKRNRLLADLARMQQRREAVFLLGGPATPPAAGKRKPARQKTIRGHISLTKASMRTDPRPIDPHCECYTCSGHSSGGQRGFSRAYLHHLFKSEGERSLAGSLVSIHNIHFMNKMMERIREGIATDTLDAVEAQYIHPGVANAPAAPPAVTARQQGGGVQDE